MEWMDLHAHVLPGVDDGARNRDAALALLREQQAQGAFAVVATPHFYAAQVQLEDYMQQTRTAYRRLAEDCRAQGLPELFLGYEVLFFPNMASSGVLQRLVLGGSGYLLLELPYQAPLTETLQEELVTIRLNCGLTPILAHLERYAGQSGFRDVLQLIDDGYAEAQINASSLLHWGSRRVCLDLLEGGYIRYLGSDAHSMERRPPQLAQAAEILQKKRGRSTVRRLAENSRELYAALREAAQTEASYAGE